MKTILRLISYAALIVMFVAAIMVFNDRLDRKLYEHLALAGTILWFVTVPFWMKRRLHHSE